MTTDLMLMDLTLASDEISQFENLEKESIDSSFTIQLLQEDVANLKDQVRMIRRERDELKQN